MLTSSCEGFYAGSKDEKTIYRLEMTKAEVGKVFGEPFRFDKGTYLDKEVEIWDYDYGNGSGVRLYFCKDCREFYRRQYLSGDGCVVAITLRSPIYTNTMKAIHELLEAFIPLKYNLTKGQECVKWAEDRLLYNEEGDDKDVILLAGSTVEEEIKGLSLKILERYIDKQFLEEEYWVGKFIVKLYESYKSGSVSIPQLDTIISWLYANFDYPNWLAMLSRNCEYATDMEEFRKPFEDEFLYIYEIWKDACSVDEFNSKYDRQVSNSHDVI